MNPFSIYIFKINAFLNSEVLAKLYLKSKHIFLYWGPVGFEWYELNETITYKVLIQGNYMYST